MQRFIRKVTKSIYSPYNRWQCYQFSWDFIVKQTYYHIFCNTLDKMRVSYGNVVTVGLAHKMVLVDISRRWLIRTSWVCSLHSGIGFILAYDKRAI